ncbi:MAG: acyl-CoA thioesterase [Beijerinckiaceae bacterium]
MNLFFRLMLVIIQAFRRPALKPMDESVTSFRVLPNDLDLNIHMNNGRYLTIMDLGRVDLLVRTGLFSEARRRGWFPVVGSVQIDYKRSLNPFQRYDLKTRVLGWDERWFVMEQVFVRDGKAVASAVLKAMILSRGGMVPTADVMAAVNFSQAPPKLSAQLLQRLDMKKSGNKNLEAEVEA